MDPDAIYVDHGFTGTQRERPRLHRGGVHATTQIAELFGVARSTVYRAI